MIRVPADSPVRRTWSTARGPSLGPGHAVAGAAILLVTLGAPSIAHGALPLARPSPQQTAAPAAAGAWSPDTLDRLLAPVALYPDPLLAQMLVCAAEPGTVAALAEWLTFNDTLKGSQLQDAATQSGFGPSFAALAIFPDIVDAMAANLPQTTQIGQAFAADRSAVFDSIQRLRSRAQAAGTLKTTPQQDVEMRTTSSGGQAIVIEPANPQVVYVPQYNPQTVYTQPATTTVVVQDNDGDEAAAAAAGALVGFAAGIAIGAAIDNDYYYGPYGWHGGAYMYNDAWDDWYDAREDAREDWMDHREDIVEERGDRREDLADERTDRRENATAERTERRENASGERAQSAQQQRTGGQQTRSERATATQESRGYGGDGRTSASRSGTRSDALSGYSSGRSERAASQRGQRSRSSSRGGGRRSR